MGTSPTRKAGVKAAGAKKARPTPRQILVRRIVVVLLALAIVALLVWGVWAAATSMIRVGADAPEATVTTVPAPTSAAEWAALSEQDRLAALKGKDPEVCPADSVDISVEAAARAEGGFNVTARIVNNFPIPCLVDTDQSRLTVLISSGDETIWTSESCPADAVALLLSSHEETTRTIVWPGQHRASGCGAGDKAKPGSYRATVSVGGAEDSASFEVR